jgi:serine/threonine protein kinase
MTGQLLGHYRVPEQVGSEGVGEVYRAPDERLGRNVALKVVRPPSWSSNLPSSRIPMPFLPRFPPLPPSGR